MEGVYITADHIGSPGGGGQVTFNEATALSEFCGREATLIGGDALRKGPYSQLDIPALWDLAALNFLQENVDWTDRLLRHEAHAHFYSWSFSHTVRYLNDLRVTTSYTTAANDWRISKEEFEICGFPYPYSHLSDPTLWEIYKRGLVEASMVIVPSTMSKIWLESEGVERITVIPHGIVPVLKPISPYPDTLVVGYLGQIGPDKGLRYLIEAWGRLDYSHAVLKLAGPGTETLEPLIRSITNGGRFELLGYVADPTEFYDSLSVYVHPSVFESFGIEVLEAMARGRPVIASKGAGASELVPYPEWTFPPRDVERLAELLEKMVVLERSRLVRHVEWERLVTGGRRVAEAHSWVNIREQYKSLWRIMHGSPTLS